MLDLGYRQVGRDFPVFLHPETNEEYALARTERKTGPGYTGFTFDTNANITLDEDLSRRDLTINAIAENEHGDIIDPFDGRRDLRDGVLRHVSPAFIEDPLRVLRVCRFAARFGFTIAPETLSLMQEISRSGELDALAAERVWTEIRRALDESHPELFVKELRACGALAKILPEVDVLFGIPQPTRYHPEIDTGEHVLMALQQCEKFETTNRVRFAVLVHDVGKGVTPSDKWPSHAGHEQLGEPLVDAICDRLKVPRDYRSLALTVTRYHLQIHRVQEMRPAKQLGLIENLDALRRPERCRDVLVACRADATGRLGKQADDYPQMTFIKGAVAAVNAVPIQQIRDSTSDNEKFVADLRAARIKALREYNAAQDSASAQ